MKASFSLIITLAMGATLIASFQNASSASDVAIANSDLYDYLVMDACSDVNGRPVSPLDKNCMQNSRHNLQVGEPAYFAGSSTVRAGNDVRYVYIYNFPLELSGADRAGNKYPLIAHWMDHTGYGVFGTGRDNIGLVSMIPLSGGGYRAVDMVSTGNTVVNFEVSDLQGVESGVGRFKNSWVFAESGPGAHGLDVVPVANSVQAALYAEHLLSVQETALESGTPPSLNSSVPLSPYLSVRMHLSEFAFGGPAADAQMKIDTLVEDKYAGGITVASTGDISPGTGRAAERVYLTRELGITRWEAWKTDDNPSLDKSAAYRSVSNCSMPARFPQYDVATGLHMYAPAIATDVDSSNVSHSYYARMVKAEQADGTWLDEKWVMESCSDWSTVSQLPTAIVPSSVIGLSANSPDAKAFLQTLVSYFM